MKRLTIRNSDGRAGFAGSGSPTENTLRIPMMLNRLAEYEDAEEQGLLVRLPCKVGDTVYWLDYNRSACKTCDLFSSFYGVDCMCDKHYELYPEINSVYDDEHCPKHFIEIVNRKADLEWIVYHLNDFGKTVFLTREAAEKALEDA